MSKILIIEDDENILDLEKDYIEASEMHADGATDGNTGLELALNNEYDLILLDVMLPGINGFEICKKIRETKNTPIIFVTAKRDELDKISGLGYGADDYIVKPFLPKELIYRVNAILRRSYKGENPIVKLSGSEIDFDRAEVIKNGEHIALTAKEHDILAALYRNAGRIVTLDALCEAAWGDNPYGYENSLMAHIRRIREKIEVNPSQPVSLITIKGLGYKLIVGDK